MIILRKHYSQRALKQMSSLSYSIYCLFSTHAWLDRILWTNNKHFYLYLVPCWLSTLPDLLTVSLEIFLDLPLAKIPKLWTLNIWWSRTSLPFFLYDQSIVIFYFINIPSWCSTSVIFFIPQQKSYPLILQIHLTTWLLSLSTTLHLQATHNQPFTAKDELLIIHTGNKSLNLISLFIVFTETLSITPPLLHPL